MTTKQDYVKRLESLKTDRTLFETDWRDLNEFFMTRIARGLQGSSTTRNGPQRNRKIIDTTPILARRTMTSGLMGGYTSPSKPWFRFATPDPEMMEFAAVKLWLHQVENIIRNLFNRSNLYNALPFIYDNAGVYGTGAMATLEDAETVARFYPFAIGTYYLDQNEKYITDTCYREIKMTVRQLKMMFGIENLMPRTQMMCHNNQLNQQIDVVHLVEPNADRDYGKVDNKNMAFRSVWYEKGGQDEIFLRRSGFEEFPIQAFLWDKDDPDDAYGVGAAMDALGDAKGLQFQQRRKQQAIDKQVDPPLQAPTSLKDHAIYNMPGGITTVDVATGGQGLKPLYEVRPEMRGLLDDIAESQSRINSAFYADLFLMMSLDHRAEPATATEIAERHEEKLVMLGPTLERLNTMLRSIIDRTFAIGYRRDIFPPAPQELRGVDLKIEYISILAQAQKMVNISAIERLWGFAGGVVGLEPSAIDKLDADQSIDEYADMLGVPPGVVRSDDQVASIREAKAQQAQAAAQAAAVPTMAKTAKDLSQSDMAGDNALTALLGGAQQADVAAA